MFLSSCKRTPETKSHSPLYLVFLKINVILLLATLHFSVCFVCLFVCFFFTYNSSNTSKYLFNFMLGLNYNIVRSTVWLPLQTHIFFIFYFLHFQSLYVAGQAPVSDHAILVSLVATYENRSCKRPVSVTGTVSVAQESLHNIYYYSFKIFSRF